MAAKLFNSLTDDNPDLQKQIGCMTGIFQLFDRQHLLTGGSGSRIVGHSPRKLSSGNSHFSSAISERESNHAYVTPASLEKYSHKSMQDKQRISTESSRASSSSSQSSSFSSPECNRATQLEQASFDRMIFPESPLREPAITLQHPSPKFSRQSIDLLDFVKESMYKEVQGSSVKAKTIEESTFPVEKYSDSRRMLSKGSYYSCGSGLEQTQRTPTDLQETLRVLAKLQEAPQYHDEPRALLRSSSYHTKEPLSSNLKDARRFSYDEREINRTPFDSRNPPRSTIKLEDLPRLSLDSREGSMQSLSTDLKSNVFSKSLQKDYGEFDVKFQCQQQSPGNQARPPSVVAKLMGLETLPDSISSSVTMGSSRSYQDEDFNFTSFEKADQSKPIRLSNSSKNSRKEPSSPCWRSTDCSMKPKSRFPIEPAPWRQVDGTWGSQKPASRSTRGPAKAPTTLPTVYSEIEKRLKDLEFMQSGKDRRALKRILETMQAKGLLETPKERQDSNLTSHKDHHQMLLGFTRSVGNRKPQTDQVLASMKSKHISAQNHESPIVIMKPAKLIENSGVPAASVISLDGLSGVPKIQGRESIDNRKGLSSGRTSHDLIFRSSQQVNGLTSVNKKSNKTLKTERSSATSHKLTEEGNAGSGRSSASISSRMQQNKLEREKRFRPPTPDSSKSARQSTKQQAESNSPGGRRRSKHFNYQQGNDQSSEVSVKSRNITSQETEDPVESNITTMRSSKKDEVTSSERPTGMSSMQNSSMKSSEFMLSGLVEKKSSLTLSEGESAESGFVPPEYSSPVSVLDNEVCKPDSPPVKYAGRASKVNVTMCDENNSSAIQWSSVDSFVSNSTESGVTFEVNRKKLQSIENLVQKLRRLNSSHDEGRTDYIASLCENTNPDHRYISEILLTSGLLLRDLNSSFTDFQFHSSGHPINPELFLVLEKTKASISLKEECGTTRTTQFISDKTDRKLIFDVVNAILARKLSPAGLHSEPWVRPLKVARNTLNAQKLLRELCSEIDGLQAENLKCSSDEDDSWKNILCKDVMHRSGRWEDFDGEISGAVLDIERMIFKDLVNEVVTGESAGLTTKTGRRRLFAK